MYIECIKLKHISRRQSIKYHYMTTINNLENDTMTFIRDESFAGIGDDPMTYVSELTPRVFEDGRGSFSEVLKGDLSWIKQVNRSVSHPGVVRGCHAQKGKWCQSKLVESLSVPIFDFIVDARPDSTTFGVSKMYRLDPFKQNKLFVPRGFLHSFLVPLRSQIDAIFMYYCDNEFNKDSELCINPKSVLDSRICSLRSWCYSDSLVDAEFHEAIDGSDDDRIYSEKDLSGMDYDEWMNKIKSAYSNGNLAEALWYK